ncbi:MAG: tetratricopeptide repeat protein [Verrucomicrobia bacterium]|nr:tetratricopeptide repeat protein [Cytophagales bacterium]
MQWKGFLLIFWMPVISFAQGSLVASMSDTLYINVLNQTAEKNLNSNPDTAFVYAKKALQLAEKHSFCKGLAQGYENLGWIFYNQGVFKQSIAYFLKSIDFYKEIGDKKGIAETYNHLGIAYYYGLEIEISMKSHLEALKMYETYPDERGKAETFGYLGTLHEKKFDYKKALFYQENALKIYEKLNDQAGTAKILENLGSIYEDFEDYPKAYEYFSKALLLNRKANNQITVINNLNNLGDTYRKQGRYAEALQYTSEACQLSKKLHQTYMLRSALKDLAKTYIFLGDFKKAHAYLDSSYTLYEEIYDDESAKQIARMQTVYETEKNAKELAIKNAEIELLERETSISRLWITLLVGGTILLLALGMIFFRLQKLKAQKETEIAEKNRKLMITELENAQLNEQKLKTELENRELREQQMQQELEIRSKELTSHTLQIVQKNKFLEELKVKLNDIRKSEKDKGKQLKELIQSIDYSFKSDRDWDDFKRVFEQVHQDFFQKLQTTYTDLSANDLRLCALLKLNLNSNDMATLLSISQDSLRIARYRLRKKLHLEERTNLTTFLMSV